MALGKFGPDPVRRVVTFVTAPLKTDVLVTGAPVLTAFVAATRTDANVIAKLAVQRPQPAEDRAYVHDALHPPRLRLPVLKGSL